MVSVVERVDLPVMEAGLAGLLRADRLRSVYQPIVCLEKLAPVGVEALIRGPAGSALESPQALFGAARAEGRVATLDWASRRAGLMGVLSAGLTGPAHLFLNAEPEGLGAMAFPGFDEVADAVAAAGVQVVLEITERALTRQPAELLRTVQRVREMGWKLAIDDVGAERASLALMPFLAPDVIKLDLRLIQARTSTETTEIVNAVLAQAERTGAVVLAEGIETEQHLELARSMGARLGQGWYFGRPGKLRTDIPYIPMLLNTVPIPRTPSTPWEAVRPEAVCTAAAPLLVAMSQTLERQAAMGGDASVVLGTFQRQEFFTPHTARRYQALAGKAALVAAVGVDMDPEPAPGVRGCSIAADDDLAREWDVAVVGPHFAGALIAREHPTHVGGRRQRLFDYQLTYDRDRVLAVARSLMSRV